MLVMLGISIIPSSAISWRSFLFSPPIMSVVLVMLGISIIPSSAISCRSFLFSPPIMSVVLVMLGMSIIPSSAISWRSFLFSPPIISVVLVMLGISIIPSSAISWRSFLFSPPIMSVVLVMLVMLGMSIIPSSIMSCRSFLLSLDSVATSSTPSASAWVSFVMLGMSSTASSSWSNCLGSQATHTANAAIAITITFMVLVKQAIFLQSCNAFFIIFVFARSIARTHVRRNLL